MRGLTAHPAESEPLQRKLTSFKEAKLTKIAIFMEKGGVIYYTCINIQNFGYLIDRIVEETIICFR
jgi:hypothetical protein